MSYVVTQLPYKLPHKLAYKLPYKLPYWQLWSWGKGNFGINWSPGIQRTFLLFPRRIQLIFPFSLGRSIMNHRITVKFRFEGAFGDHVIPASAQSGTNFKAETGEVLKISKEGDAAFWSMGSILILKTFFSFTQLQYVWLQLVGIASHPFLVHCSVGCLYRAIDS